MLCSSWPYLSFGEQKPYRNGPPHAADFSGSNLDRCQFHQTNLSRANLAGATNVRLDPAENKVKGATISLDAAIGVVTPMGIHVSGFGAH
jgi:hypothetical protein